MSNQKIQSIFQHTILMPYRLILNTGRFSLFDLEYFNNMKDPIVKRMVFGHPGVIYKSFTWIKMY